VSSTLAGVLRFVSIVACLIVAASFVLFVVNQTGTASTHQQQELNGGVKAHHDRKSTLRRTVDEVSEAITSPFSGVTAGSSSEWVIRGVNLLLTLIVYGFALGFLARVIRVRL
jgi:hypothetical protein